MLVWDDFVLGAEGELQFTAAQANFLRQEQGLVTNRLRGDLVDRDADH